MIDEPQDAATSSHAASDPLSDPIVAEDNGGLVAETGDSAESATVVALQIPADRDCSDEVMVQRMLDGDVRAKALFFDRYGRHVRGILVRILGPHVELADLTHDVFVTAFRRLHKLNKKSALKSWLTSVAVFRAREYIRARRRHGWLQFFAPDEMPEEPAVHADPAVREALAAVYRLLEKLPVEQRLAFGLRFISGMRIAEGSEAMGVSPSTFKRKLRQAREVFETEAARLPVLEDWLVGDS